MKEAARQLRKERTPAEERLWAALRNRQLGGLKFRRQVAVGSVVLDFYCAELKLVIEVDGGIHDTQQERDAARTEHLEAYGYRVIRFRNADVLRELDRVLARILYEAGAECG